MRADYRPQQHVLSQSVTFSAFLFCSFSFSSFSSLALSTAVSRLAFGTNTGFSTWYSGPTRVRQRQADVQENYPPVLTSQMGITGITYCVDNSSYQTMHKAASGCSGGAATTCARKCKQALHVPVHRLLLPRHSHLYPSPTPSIPTLHQAWDGR